MVISDTPILIRSQHIYALKFLILDYMKHHFLLLLPIDPPFLYHTHPYLCRGPSQQCQRLFQVNTPVTSMCLHPNQSTLVVADQSGTIYIWDLSTDHNEQHVSFYNIHTCTLLSFFSGRFLNLMFPYLEST